MKPHKLGRSVFLFSVLGCSFAASPHALANEVSLKLANVDEYAYRSILIDLKSGEQDSECEQLSSYNQQAKAFVCRKLSGVTESYSLRDIKEILFPVLVRNQNQQQQQACVPEIIPTFKKEVIFVIPEKYIQISEIGLFLSSSWIDSKERAKPKLTTKSIDPRLGLATILEPQSLSYNASNQTFLFKGRYVEYRTIVKCISGGGTGGGGKGGGRRHRSSP